MASGKLLCNRALGSVLCYSLDGGMEAVGGRRKKEVVYIYIYIYIKLWLICVVIQQKPTQHCKVTFLELKNKNN